MQVIKNFFNFTNNEEKEKKDSNKKLIFYYPNKEKYIGKNHLY